VRLPVRLAALRTTRRRRAVVAGAAALAVGALVVVLVALRATGPEIRTFSAPALADAVPYDGRSPREPIGDDQRVLLELQRPALGALQDLGALDGAARRAYVASLRRERQALRSALQARGVRLRDAVGFERTWNGFAATVRTRDLSAISSLGVRAQPVRRFYPSVGEPVPLGSGRQAAPLPTGKPVALLAAGVRGADPGLLDGFDVVDGDTAPTPDPDPRDPGRRETSGSTLARVLLRAGRRVRPIRIAALQAAGGSEYATTDTLLAGLERAVDPDADGDPRDAARVALVGVHAPYAGFADAPEAAAVDAAAALGTLVVAPAGHEGPARGPNGTVASPASAAGALAVGALAAATPAVELQAPGLRVRAAAVLGGQPPRSPLAVAAGRRGVLGPRRIAVVRAGANPPAQAARAAARGAQAVLLAEPRGRRVLPAVAAGRIAVPVVGVTGAAARAALALPREARIRFGRPRRPVRGPGGRASPFASRGPSLQGAPKPDLAAASTALTGGLDGRPVAAGGAGIAAALVAVEAARLVDRETGLSPAELAAALCAAADPGGRESAALPAAATGAGALRRPAAGRLVRRRPELTLIDGATSPRRARLTLRDAPLQLAARLDGRSGRASVSPRRLRAPGAVQLRVDTAGLAAGTFATGRVTGADPAGRNALSVPFAVPAGAPGPLRIGRIVLVRRDGAVSGARFALGAFDRGDPLAGGTAFAPAQRLDLELIDAKDTLVRRLTPPGGARQLLPAEYAYTLDARTRRDLPATGRLRFRVRARAPRRAGASTERTSESFTRR